MMPVRSATKRAICWSVSWYQLFCKRSGPGGGLLEVLLEDIIADEGEDEVERHVDEDLLSAGNQEVAYENSLNASRHREEAPAGGLQMAFAPERRCS